MSFLRSYFEKIPENQRESSAICFFAGLDHLKKNNPEVVNIILKELQDQRSHLKMIASENYCSLATQIAMGNLLTDKYSEGFVHHRFYAGCENVDAVEALAIEEAKSIFGCDHAYVQPHSGADANLVAFWAILVQKVQNKELERLGKKSIDELSREEYELIRKQLVNQKVMGLSLGSGGHLTHGYRHNVSGMMMESVPYHVNPKTELIDYKDLEEQVKKEKPAILIGGYSAYSRLINFAKMREIADTVGAVLVVDMAHFAGLVAGKAIQGEFDPVPFAHIVTSTTHKTLRGPRGGLILCKNEFKEIIDKGCPLVLGGPLPHIMAAKAVAFKEANTESFKAYAKQVIVNAQALAKHLVDKGLKLLTGGTDNHLLVIDVMSGFGLTGRQAESALRASKITVNRNSIPFDPNGPWYTSGVRIGTPALTTRGLKEDEMRQIGDLIVAILKATKAKIVDKTGKPSKAEVLIEPEVLDKVRREVDLLVDRFPLYPELNNYEE